MKKIVHLTESNIPDTRVEKTAYLQRQTGKYELHYIGGPQIKPPYLGVNIDEIFHSVNFLSWSRSTKLGLPFAFSSIRKEVHKLLIQIKPDLIHAHNIFAARICIELGYEFVYDDHEFWTYQALARNVVPKSFFAKRRITDYIFDKMIKKWEPLAFTNAKLVIGVSTTQIDDIITMYNLENSRKKFICVSNYPSKIEVDQMNSLLKEKSIDKIMTILVGKTGGHFFTQSTDKIVQSFSSNNLPLTLLGKYDKKKVPKNITFKGYVPHTEFLAIVSNHQVGLMQFTKNELPEYYQYVAPNRIFFYVHLGVIPVFKNQMVFMKDVFGDLAYYVEDEYEIATLITKLHLTVEDVNLKSSELIEFAQKNILYEIEFENLEKEYDKIFNS